MRYMLQVTSRAAAGRDADFNRWYDETHVPEVLALPGFNSCERFVGASADGEGGLEYLAAYEVETEDPQALLQSLFQASVNMTMTDAIDPQSARFTFQRPTGVGKVMAKI